MFSAKKFCCRLTPLRNGDEKIKKNEKIKKTKFLEMRKKTKFLYITFFNIWVFLENFLCLLSFLLKFFVIFKNQTDQLFIQIVQQNRPVFYTNYYKTTPNFSDINATKQSFCFQSINWMQYLNI